MSLEFMKAIFPAAWVVLCLLMIGHVPDVMASGPEKPAATTPAKKAPAVKKAAAAKPAQQKIVKKRPPVASKSKSAREVAKTPLPSTKLDLSLPKDMVQELKPKGTVEMPKREPILPQMFGEKNTGFHSMAVC